MGYNKANIRIGEEKYSNQGCLMRVVEYNKYGDIIVEFQDKYKAKIHTSYQAFCNGNVKNPYHPTAYGVGIIGVKYPRSINCKNTKEYRTWRDMLRRCFDVDYKDKHPTYKDVSCCEEWKNYEIFYEWLHQQENFDKWLNGKRWSIDKDIFIKHNKIYSPETCCLVPHNVNSLFAKCDANRGDLPIGVSEINDGYIVECHNPFIGNNTEYLGYYMSISQSFQTYKFYKEDIIKQVAQAEYSNGNITKRCYDAMMKYEVEITD